MPEENPKSETATPSTTDLQENSDFEIDEILRSRELYPPNKIIISGNIENPIGIYAIYAISESEIIEIIPIIKLSKKYEECIKKNESDNIFNYSIRQPESDETFIMLGYGSFYNHSDTPNAELEYHKNCVVLRAIRNIQEGEEITWNYGEI